eukprot:jgi/Tetstr1/438912/TSEL_027420.t1
MDVDNAAGNRKDLGSNGEEEPVPDGPVLAANAGNGTKDPDDDRELPECFSHELIGKPPNRGTGIYDHLVKNIMTANDFERPPIIIMGGSSMFPNWKAESFQDFILTYSHSAMNDLLKKLPKH